MAAYADHAAHFASRSLPRDLSLSVKSAFRMKGLSTFGLLTSLGSASRLARPNLFVQVIVTKDYIDQWLYLAKTTGEPQRIVARWL